MENKEQIKVSRDRKEKAEFQLSGTNLYCNERSIRISRGSSKARIWMNITKTLKDSFDGKYQEHINKMQEALTVFTIYQKLVPMANSNDSFIKTDFDIKQIYETFENSDELDKFTNHRVKVEILKVNRQNNSDLFIVNTRNIETYEKYWFIFDGSRTIPEAVERFIKPGRKAIIEFVIKLSSYRFSSEGKIFKTDERTTYKPYLSIETIDWSDG